MQNIKLRLIEQRSQRLLLCPNGTILKADQDVVEQLLTAFKKPMLFKGSDGTWNTEDTRMEDVSGKTLAFVDDAYKLVIVSENLLSSAKSVTYVSATEYAVIQGKSRPAVKNMCAEGRIDGAYKTSSGWLIPADAPWPERKSRATKKESI